MRQELGNAAGAEESGIVTRRKRGEAEEGEGREGSHECERRCQRYLESNAWGEGNILRESNHTIYFGGFGEDKLVTIMMHHIARVGRVIVCFKTTF